MDRNRAPTTTPSRSKKLLGALRSALAAKFADGKLMVVNAFDVKEPKTKQFAVAPRPSLKVEGTVLLVEVAGAENKQSGTKFAQYRRARTGARE
jgi:hypothetical protein